MTQLLSGLKADQLPLLAHLYHLLLASLPVLAPATGCRADKEEPRLVNALVRYIFPVCMLSLHLMRMHSPINMALHWWRKMQRPCRMKIILFSCCWTYVAPTSLGAGCKNSNDNPVLPLLPSECHIYPPHSWFKPAISPSTCQVQAWFSWGSSEEKAMGQML